jgi:DNA-binding CsgD family transcriptional regulator
VHLTFREAEILEVLANEAPSLQVLADRLWISRNTLKTHIQTLLSKTKCHTQLELVAWAWRRGFLWWDDGERRIAIVERAP